MWVRLPVSTQQIQACFAGHAWLILLFLCLVCLHLRPHPTIHLGLSETEQRGACSGHGDGRGQMPRVHIGKGRLGVYLVRAHTLCVLLRSFTYSLGGGNGKPLQYSCLENPMDGGAWWATVHGVATSRSRLSDFTFTQWRRKWQPTPGFLPGESKGRQSLVGCRLWGRTESDTTEAT